MPFLFCKFAYAAKNRVNLNNGLEYKPIVIHPDESIAGNNIDHLSVWVFNGSEWSRIVHQIDEVNEYGEYVLEEGLPFTKGSDDGVLDLNDELVVRSGDLGCDFTAKDLKKLPSEHIIRGAWKVVFYHNKNRIGSILVAVSDRRKGKGKKALGDVRFNKAKNEIVTDTYRYSFKTDNPILLGNLFLRRGRLEHSVFESSLFSMFLDLPWWLPNFSLEENNFTSSVECWRVGPVRAIVAVGVKLKNMFSIFDLHMYSELTFYKNDFQIPTVVEFPFSPSTFFNAGSGMAYFFKFDEEGKWKIYSNLSENSPSSRLARESQISKANYYAKIEGEAGTFMMRVALGDDSRENKALPEPYLIKKGMNQVVGNNNLLKYLNKIDGDMGVFVDISSVKEGVYKFSLDLTLDSEANLNSHKDFVFPEAIWERLP